jgi:hypothetical protein
MKMPVILGLPLFAWGGMILFILVSIQVLGGLKIIRIPYKTHKANGIVILILGLIHGLAALGYLLGWITT